MTDESVLEMGPIDYIVLEWPGRQPKGDAVPLIIDLVERGIIRVLDIALMVKGDDGSVAAVDLGDLDEDSGFGVFDGATTGLISQEDLEEAATALNPGTSAAVLVWENRVGGAGRRRAPALGRATRRERPDRDPGRPRGSRADRGTGRSRRSHPHELNR